MKTYTLTTDDDKELARAVHADDLAWIVWELDGELRIRAKHAEDAREQEQAQYWRDRLHAIASDNNVVIDGLFD